MAQIEAAVPWRSGVPELLHRLKASRIRTALVTMSMRRMAELVAGALPFDAFDVIVAGDDVTHSKPHPEPYLRAAELLAVSAEECLAIEDSAPGLASAGTAGAVCIGVPLHVGLSPDDAYTLWDTLEGKAVADLAGVFASRARRVAAEGAS
jgi:HAD superfamily hydrolase (TIGR01509 family)